MGSQVILMKHVIFISYSIRFQKMQIAVKKRVIYGKGPRENEVYWIANIIIMTHFRTEVNKKINNSW